MNQNFIEHPKKIIIPQMKAYIINLKKSTDRKAYMEDLFKPYKGFLEAHFVEGVDGRQLSGEQIGKLWNQRETYGIYGRKMGNAEIGCALSHRKCCGEMLENGDEVALIVEDDLVWQDADIKGIVSEAADFLKTQDAAIVLLSGDYWFTCKRRWKNIRLAYVREAVCAQAYLINRKAARIILNMERKYLADDWYNIKGQGISLYGIYPHVADQNRRDFGTVISSAYEGTIRKNLSFGRMIHSYYRAVIKRVLLHTGHFERKKFVD